MREIVRIKFGSHLYGTETPESDLDFKAVFVPDARDILLGRVRESIGTTTKVAGEIKNTSEDVDLEAYSLQKFLNLVADGQTVAMDMLFTPAWMHVVVPDTLWLQIWDEKHHLLSRQVRGFIGYCKTQANKYGIKGSRVAASRAARDLFSVIPPQTKVREIDEAMPFTLRFPNVEHIAVVDVEIRGQGKTVPHLEVCNRKIPFTTTAKEACAIVDRLFTEYGKRALAAERSEGIDWKALSHAVRVGRQAIELLETEKVTFPRPEAAHLIAIKRGQLAYQAVAEEIEQLLVKVEQAAERSTLPEKPNQAWIDDFVAEVYRREVCHVEDIRRAS
jgi:predicted nucleotidyltransferase